MNTRDLLDTGLSSRRSHSHDSSYSHSRQRDRYRVDDLLENGLTSRRSRSPPRSSPATNVESRSNVRSKRTKYSQQDLSSPQLATEVSSSNRYYDDRTSSSSTHLPRSPPAGSQSDDVSPHGIILTCHNTNPPVESVPTPPTPTTLSSSHSRGVVRSREDSPTSRNTIPRSTSSMSSITHFSSGLSGSQAHEVTVQTMDYVAELADTMLNSGLGIILTLN